MYALLVIVAALVGILVGASLIIQALVGPVDKTFKDYMRRWR